jgi:hypothetical protein
MVKRQYSQPLKDGQEVNLERDDKEWYNVWVLYGWFNGKTRESSK